MNHESGCRLVHRYRIFRDPMPHVSLRGKVITYLITFVNRAMAVAQLTHLHLSVSSSGMTTGMAPPECFPVVPLPHKPHRVSVASDVEVMVTPSTLLSPGVEPECPDRPLPSRASLLPSVPDADLYHRQDVFVTRRRLMCFSHLPTLLMMRTCC